MKPQPVNVEVRRPDEQVSRKFVWQPGDNGLYQYQLQLAGEAPTVPIPDFEDAYQTQRVLEAAMASAVERRPVKLEEVK